mgnify:CR=1 FL=1
MVEDKKNVGLSEKMNMKLKSLTEADNIFKDETDGYRLAASLAIYKNLPFEDRKLDNYDNKYRVEAIDENAIYKNIIKEKYPHLEGQEYRAFEKLADVGMEYLSEQISKNQMIDIEKLMQDDS